MIPKSGRHIYRCSPRNDKCGHNGRHASGRHGSQVERDGRRWATSLSICLAVLRLTMAALARRANRASSIGLVGRGIQASRTPGMHEREARRLGIDYSYLLLDFDRLGLPDEAIVEAVSAAQEAGFRGLNVTHPFKQAVIPALDRLSPEAHAIGAVNTVIFDGGHRQGHNTDSWGFGESFRDGMAGVPVDSVAMFGAGGAGAAVAYALMELGVGRLSIIDSDDDARRELGLAHGRNRSRGVSRRVRIRRRRSAPPTASSTRRRSAWRNIPARPSTRRCSRATNGSPTSVYFPAETELLAKARAIGCRTLPGTGMAIYQAVPRLRTLHRRARRPSRHGRPFRGGMNAVTRGDCRGSRRSEPFATE